MLHVCPGWNAAPWSGFCTLIGQLSLSGGAFHLDQSSACSASFLAFLDLPPFLAACRPITDVVVRGVAGLVPRLIIGALALPALGGDMTRPVSGSTAFLPRTASWSSSTRRTTRARRPVLEPFLVVNPFLLT